MVIWSLRELFLSQLEGTSYRFKKSGYLIITPEKVC